MLIKNGILITQNKKREILKADILIEDGIIKKIGKIQGNGYDASNCFILPGFVNAHIHSPMSLLRGYEDDLELHNWLKKLWDIEEKLKKKDIELSTYLSIAEMLHSGTTLFFDMWNSNIEVICDIVNKIGIRAVLGPTLFLDNLKNVKSKFSKIKGKYVIPSINVHSLYTSSIENIAEIKSFSKEKNAIFQMHVSETRKELFNILNKKKKRPLELLYDLKILDNKSYLSHCVFVSKREILLAGKCGVNIINVPVSNLKLAGGGISPILEFEERGANICLGTDGAASNNSLNIIETMKFSALLQKNFYWDASVISAQKVLDFATINPFKNLPVNGGSIEVGKIADLVIIERSSNLVPNNNTISNLVYSLNPSNIRDVIVAGRFLLKNKHIEVFDEQRLIDKVEDRIKELI